MFRLLFELNRGVPNGTLRGVRGRRKSSLLDPEIRKKGNEKMKNIEEKILMADEEIKQLQNKRKKLISQQKQEERKKRDKRIYEKGAVFESIFTESKNLTKDEFYQLITSLIRKEEANLKIQKIIESREESEVENIEKEDEETGIEE